MNMQEFFEIWQDIPDVSLEVTTTCSFGTIFKISFKGLTRECRVRMCLIDIEDFRGVDCELKQKLQCMEDSYKRAMSVLQDLDYKTEASLKEVLK